MSAQKTAQLLERCPPHVLAHDKHKRGNMQIVPEAVRMWAEGLTHQSQKKVNVYSRFVFFSPDCTLHNVTTHVILVIEQRRFMRNHA